MKHCGSTISIIILLLHLPMVYSQSNMTNNATTNSIEFIYPSGSPINEDIAFYIHNYLRSFGIEITSNGYPSSEYLDRISTGEWDITLNFFPEYSLVPDFSIYDQSNLFGKLFYHHNYDYVQDLITKSNRKSISDFNETISELSNFYVDNWIPEMPLIQPNDFLLSTNFTLNNDPLSLKQYFPIQDRLRFLFNSNNNSKVIDPYIVINNLENTFDQFQFSSINDNFLTSSILFMDLFNGSFYYENAISYMKTLVEPNNNVIRHNIEIDSNLSYSSGSSIYVDDYLFTIQLYQLNILKNTVIVPDFFSRILNASISDNHLIIDINDSRIDDSYYLGHIFPTPRALLGGLLTIEDSEGDILFTALSDSFNPFDSVEWNEYETGVSTSGRYAIDNNPDNFNQNPFLLGYQKFVFSKLTDRFEIPIPDRVIAITIDFNSLIGLVMSDLFIPNIFYLQGHENLDRLQSKSYNSLPLPSTLSAYRLIFNQESDSSIRHAVPLLVNKTSLLPIVNNYASTQNSILSPKYQKWVNSQSVFRENITEGIGLLFDAQYLGDSKLSNTINNSVPTITQTVTHRTPYLFLFSSVTLVFILLFQRKKDKI